MLEVPDSNSYQPQTSLLAMEAVFKMCDDIINTIMKKEDVLITNLINQGLIPLQLPWPTPTPVPFHLP